LVIVLTSGDPAEGHQLFGSESDADERSLTVRSRRPGAIAVLLVRR
jgi:hypothetical protein